MKIIAGEKKGQKILAPKNARITRPALAKVREAIFSTVGDWQDKVVLDIFAGSGSLGLEALSRGAFRAYFIESHPQAVKCLLNNLKTLGYEKKARVFKRNLPAGLKSIKIDEVCHVIFSDPPYDKSLVQSTLEGLAGHKFIDAQSLVIIEHSPREMPKESAFSVIKQKKYGQTYISYLKLKALHA